MTENRNNGNASRTLRAIDRTGRNTAGATVLDAEAHQGIGTIRIEAPIIDCDAKQMEEEINLGRVYMA